MVTAFSGTDGAAGGMRSLFQSGAYTTKVNVSEFIDAIDPRDIPLLSMLGMGDEAGSANAGADSLAYPCLNTTHTWQSDELIPSQVLLTGSDGTGGETLTVGTVSVNYFKIGDLINVGNVARTYGIVTAINTSAGTLTIAVAAESEEGTPGALGVNVSGQTIYNLGNLQADGSTFSNTYNSTALGTDSNYTQIFHDAVSVSGTSESVEKFGITNEFDREFAKKFQELVIKLERAAHYGIRYAGDFTAANTAVLARRMGGLYGFIKSSTTTANVDNAADAKLTEKLLMDNLQDIWNDGGKPDTILVNATQKRVLSSFASPYVRTDRQESALGVVVGTYESEFGDLDIVLDRYVQPSDLIVLSREFIGIGALKGNGNDRSFFTTPVPVDGDRQTATITGEYTMEVRNADKAHGWIYGLSTTLS